MGAARMSRWSHCEICGFQYQYELDASRSTAPCGALALAVTGAVFAGVCVSAASVPSWSLRLLSCGALLGAAAFGDVCFGAQLLRSSVIAIARRKRADEGMLKAQQQGAAQAARAAQGLAEIELRRQPERTLQFSVVFDDDEDAEMVEQPESAEPWPPSSQPAPGIARRQRAALVVLVLVAAPLLLLAYVQVACLALRDKTALLVAKASTAMGVLYLALASLLHIGAQFSAPQQWVLRRGTDGFFLVKCLTEADREAVVQSQALS